VLWFIYDKQGFIIFPLVKTFKQEHGFFSPVNKAFKQAHYQEFSKTV